MHKVTCTAFLKINKYPILCHINSVYGCIPRSGRSIYMMQQCLGHIVNPLLLIHFRFAAEIVSISRMSTIEAQPPIVTRGRLLSREQLDREEIASYSLSILAIDMSNRPLNMTLPVTVTVLDRNDITPTFSRTINRFNILEGTRTTLVTDLFVSKDYVLTME